MCLVASHNLQVLLYVAELNTEYNGGQTLANIIFINIVHICPNKEILNNNSEKFPYMDEDAQC